MAFGNLWMALRRLVRHEPEFKKRIKDKSENKFIIYLAVGSTHNISSGLDRVTALHWGELIDDHSLNVQGFIVNPNGPTQVEYLGDNAVLRTYSSTIAPFQSPMKRMFFKIGFAFNFGGLLQGITLHSRAVWKDIRAIMTKRTPDMIVVDHIYSLSNVPLLWLMSFSGKILFIAHDVTPTLVRELNVGRDNRRMRLGRMLDYWKAYVVEWLIMRKADRIVFLSDYDRALYPNAIDKSMALLPLARNSKASAVPNAGSEKSQRVPFRSDIGAFVIFLGSPNFFPNAHAIEWIRHALSPALWNLNKEISIVLVGKGTQTIQGDSPNVIGAGYVDDTDLESMLQRATALIAPVVHGSGLKIKILDALTLGCPVIATEESLRGFGYFAIEPKIKIADPDQSAKAIDKLARDQINWKSSKENIMGKIASYEEYRQRRLSILIHELVA